MSTYLSTVTHDITTNTVELVWVEEVYGDDGVLQEVRRKKSQNYSSLQTEELRNELGSQAEKYVALFVDTPYVPQNNVKAPTVVTRFQAMAALYNAGLLDVVETLINKEDTPALVKLAWNNAQEFARNNSTLLLFASELKLTIEQIDELFLAASQIKA